MHVGLDQEVSSGLEKNILTPGFLSDVVTVIGTDEFKGTFSQPAFNSAVAERANPLTSIVRGLDSICPFLVEAFILNVPFKGELKKQEILQNQYDQRSFGSL